MAYNRQPNVIFAGRALRQNPPPTTVNPPGIVPVTLEANVATTSSLGVVQIGNNINVDANGVISTSSTTDLISVKLTAVNYTALDTDYYIGATKKDIEITLPLGVVGKVYIVKNQATGNIKVRGSGGQTLDSSTTKTLGTEDSIMVVFDGTRWNII